MLRSHSHHQNSVDCMNYSEARLLGGRCSIKYIPREPDAAIALARGSSMQSWMVASTRCIVRHFSVLMSHSRMTPSSLPVASNGVPVMAVMASTMLEWVGSDARSCIVAESQMRTSPSVLLVANQEQSGRHGDSSYCLRVSCQGGSVVAGGQVEDTYRAVAGAGGQPRAVRRDGQDA